MSFRDNLQHLRAERNMTQEQLAMLLGVSRQSVTKWEAEKSSPEMDKLLKMCQIFDCTLDDLVTGDLTQRATRPQDGSAVQVPSGPPTDICGYDEHMRRFAWQVPTGIAIILAATGVGFLFEGALSFGAADPDLIMIFIILLGVLGGLAFCIPAGMEHSAFVKAHPFVEDFYTEDDRLRARSALSRGLVMGIGLIFIGVACIMLLGEDPATDQIGLCLLLLFIAAGVWLIVHFGMMFGRTNVAGYNQDAADNLEMEDILQAELRSEVREALLAHKRFERKLAAICGAIMLVATIVGLLMLFVPVFSVADPDTFEPLGTTASWFWMAWVVGGILCGVVYVIGEAFCKNE